MPYLITNADIGKKIYLEGSIDSKTLGFINAVNNLNGTLIKTTKNFINDPTTVTYTTTYTTVDKKGYIAVGQATGSLTFKFASTPAGTLSASVKIYNSITNTLVTTLTISNTAITTTYPSLPRGVYKYEITYTGTIAAPPSTVLTINTGGTESTTATATVVNKHKKLLFNDITKTLAQLGIQYDARLGDLYRGWGSFIVNGNNIQNTSITRSHVINSATDLANNASATEMKIDETKLFINSSGSSYDGSSTINNPTIDPGTGLPSPYSPSPSAMSNQYFVLMNHISGNKDTGKPKSWLGLDEQNYITKDIISVSRLGEDDIDATFSSQTPTFVSGSYQLPSLIQKSKLNSVSVKGGVSASFSGLSGDGNFSKTIFAENKAVTAVADFNGDGFPDHIVDSNIQFTNPNGFLSSKNANIGSYSISRTDDALGLGAGTNFTHGSASYSLSRNTQFPNTF
ncbi:hypothetical protein AB4Y90_06905 [Chryseobacterium sp. 2TAF14]|uniref:hypothetical protein n=1 Tax=Chryseobacterium sp. 2TAF14 TaxID=3233007 RepID=UPI003F93AA01